MNPSKKLSEKNTKQEILDAYYQALATIEGEPIAQPDLDRINEAKVVLDKVTEIKQEISHFLDEASSRLLLDLDAVGQSRNLLVKEKRRLLDYYHDQGKNLDEEINNIKETWQKEQVSHAQFMAEEISQIKIQRKRDDEEYQYNLSIERRKENDEYQQKHELIKKDISERELRLKNREQEITRMEEELSAVPERIEEAVKRAKEELARELLGKHTNDLKELKLIHEHETTIAGLNNSELTNDIQILRSEIEASKRIANDNSKQLQEMAVSVIEGRAIKSTSNDVIKE